MATSLSVRAMAKVTPIRHRVRSTVTPKRDHNAEAAQNLVDTMEGKLNPKRRELPPMDLKQTMQAMILVTSKEPCYLCEKAPHCVQIFHVPQGLNALGQQLILYTLCFACKADVSSPSKVEYKLVRHLQSENSVLN